ncbi:MAG TPA: hypothetical protein VKM55_20750 [Candidatus Lokiarchaeia archaeon]|nr:hypothetical protein [Candidatus Lokiarchaeia archaeon]
MEQVTCVDQSGLSEIEKFVLVVLKNLDKTDLQDIHSKFHFPNSFLTKILVSLHKKGLLFLETKTNHAFLGDAINNTDLNNNSYVSALSFKEPFELFCSSQFSHRIMKVLDHLYQNSTDLCILNYHAEALDNIHEIIHILKDNVIRNFDKILLEFDEEFISFFERNQNYFNENNGVQAIDFLLNIIYKIINKLHDIIDDIAIDGKQVSRFKNLYEIQKDSMVELQNYLNQVFKERENTITPEGGTSRPLSYHVLYFNKKIGPQIFFETTNDLTEEFKLLMKKLMDFLNPEPFLYTIQAYTTLNYQFDLESPLARGSKEYLQISLVFNKCGMNEFGIFKKVLLDIANKLQINKDFYKIFYDEHQASGTNELVGQEGLIDLKNEFLDKFSPLNNLICFIKTYDS